MFSSSIANNSQVFNQQAGLTKSAMNQVGFGQPEVTRCFKQIGYNSAVTVLQSIQTLTVSAEYQHGWILVIAPVRHLSKALLEQAQIDTRRILLISEKQISHYDNLMRDALTCSTCSAVVSFLPGDHQALADYQYLAEKYGTPLINHTATGAATQH